MPNWYVNAPEPVWGDDFYLRAYDELSSERLFSDNVIGQIPWSKIIEYVNYHDLDRDLVEPFIYIIRCMEKADLDLIHKENERQRQAAKRKTKKGLGRNKEG